METPVNLPEGKRLRVAVLNRHFCASSGGAEHYSMALVENLAAQHEIHVFAQKIDHDWPGVTYHHVATLVNRPRWLNQLWYATVTWWATRKGFDVVHSHENTWHGQVQTVHVLPVKYNLFHGRGGWSLAMRWLKVVTSPRLLVYLALEHSRFAVSGSRVVVLASKTLIPQTLAAYPGCESAIQVITPGVDRIFGVASVEEKSAARSTLGLPEVGHGILFIGNNYRKKGLQALISALNQLPQSSYLIVVGNPVHIPVFKAQAVALGLDDRVHFLGAVADIRQAYVAADCLAHPTHEDTFAMVVLEAMSHGLPVVVSCERFCGIAGLLLHERDALLLDDPRDVDALATALLRLITEPMLATRLAQAGLVFAGAMQWSAIAKQQAEIYRRVATSRTE